MNKILFGVVFLTSLLFSALSFAGGPHANPQLARNHHTKPNDQGFYFGGILAFPATLSDRHFETVPAIVFPADLRSRGYNIGGGGFIGYMFNHHWMLELGSTYFGDTNYKVFNATTGVRVGSASVTDQYLVFLTGLYNVQLTHFLALYGRLGGGFYHKRYTVSVTGFPTQISTYSTLAFVYGVGLNFTITKNVGARLEYTGTEATDHLDNFHFLNDYASVQLYYKFLT